MMPVPLRVLGTTNTQMRPRAPRHTGPKQSNICMWSWIPAFNQVNLRQQLADGRSCDCVAVMLARARVCALMYCYCKVTDHLSRLISAKVHFHLRLCSNDTSKFNSLSLVFHRRPPLLPCQPRTWQGRCGLFCISESISTRVVVCANRAHVSVPYVNTIALPQLVGLDSDVLTMLGGWSDPRAGVWVVEHEFRVFKNQADGREGGCCGSGAPLEGYGALWELLINDDNSGPDNEAGGNVSTHHCQHCN